MRTLVALIVVVFALSACTTTPKPVIDQTRFVVVTPPETLYDCPVPARPPKADTLTNKQVADYIDKLYKALVKCGINSRKIKEYVTEMETVYDDLQLN